MESGSKEIFLGVWSLLKVGSLCTNRDFIVDLLCILEFLDVREYSFRGVWPIICFDLSSWSSAFLNYCSALFWISKNLDFDSNENILLLDSILGEWTVLVDVFGVNPKIFCYENVSGIPVAFLVCIALKTRDLLLTEDHSTLVII